MGMKQIGSYSPIYWLYHTLWTGVDWLFPPVCGGCNKFGERWCPECQQEVFKLNQSICPRCGSFEPRGLLCASCKNTPPPYVALRSWGRYAGPLREAIHRLKYRKDIGLAEVLAIHLIEVFQSTSWQVDMITAVPLGLIRAKERGYNQSSLLARPLALATGISFQPDAIARARETASQVGLSAQRRKENVKDAFTAKVSRVNRKGILIVDDVTTTGATIQACALALRNAGASQVFGLTLARSMLEEDIPNATQAASSVSPT